MRFVGEALGISELAGRGSGSTGVLRQSSSGLLKGVPPVTPAHCVSARHTVFLLCALGPSGWRLEAPIDARAKHPAHGPCGLLQAMCVVAAAVCICLSLVKNPTHVA